ncbi:MAG: hypothetical protein R3D68_17710 [Hyphomicrobiaceae bacterium]
MTTQSKSALTSLRRLAGGALVAAATTLASGGLQAATAAEIEVVIDRVKALDVIDLSGGADFYAQVTIAGEVFKTEPMKDQNEISPNWVIRKRVHHGTYDVKLEILDKDVSKDDPIDINRVDPKRDLDFRVNTRTCGITGFAQYYHCGTIIQRAGNEKKKAEITFRVYVRR